MKGTLNENLIKVKEGYVITEDSKVEIGDYGVGFAIGINRHGRGWYLFKNDGTPKGKLNAICENTKKVIYSSFELDNIQKFDLSKHIDPWKIGNILSVTTLYDYEQRKDFPNHNEWENFGKRTYIGEIIEVDKGLALKTDDGSIFKTQGTYWFGSILDQDVTLIKQSIDDNIFTVKELRFIYDTAIHSVTGELNHNKEFDRVLDFIQSSKNIQEIEFDDNLKIKDIKNGR